MSPLSWQEEAAKQARILQIIIAAMLGGCLFFLLIVLTIGLQSNRAVPSTGALITLVAVIRFAAELVARWIFLGFLTRKARRAIVTGTYPAVNPRAAGAPAAPLPAEAATASLDPSPAARYLLTVFQSRTIASAAMFEGCGFFATIAYLVEGNPIALGLAVLTLLLIAAHFPTPSRVIGWVETELDAANRTGDLG